MADAKRFILHSTEIAQREQPFSLPWNPKSRLIGVQLSRELGLKRTAVSYRPHPRRGSNLLSTTLTIMKKSGSTFYPVAAWLRLMMRSS